MADPQAVVGDSLEVEVPVLPQQSPLFVATSFALRPPAAGEAHNATGAPALILLSLWYECVLLCSRAICSLSGACCAAVSHPHRIHCVCATLLPRPMRAPHIWVPHDGRAVNLCVHPPAGWQEGLVLPEAVPGSGSLDLTAGVGNLPAVVALYDAIIKSTDSE